MSQTRLGSLVETILNVAVGFVVSFGITDLVMPLYGHDVSASDNLEITTIFTVASILRSYTTRRAFNAWLRRASKGAT